MEIILLSSSVIVCASILTLKSMKEFLEEAIVQTAEEQTVFIVESNEELYSILNTALSSGSRSKNIVVEKMYIKPKPVIAVYTKQDRSLLGDQPIPGYSVYENHNSQEKNGVLLEQYIITHKYRDTAYISSRSVLFTNSLMKEFAWDGLLNQAHTYNQQVLPYSEVYQLLSL